MRRTLTILALLALVAPPLTRSGGAQQIPRASDVVRPKVYISLAPVPRGGTAELAVVAHIRSGFHINSHQPKENYLIPTVLTADSRPGISVVGATYPPGVMRKFKFTEKALSVYAGTVTVRLKLQIALDAPLGALKLPLTLRYQPCNDEVCLPPVKIPLVADLEIADAGVKSAPQHSEIFSPAPAKKQQ